MIAPGIPENEKQRLQSLNSLNILDSLPEDEFDAIVSMASQICETPISLITMVDHERQWFKAKVGLKVNETPREYAFCAHAINEPEKIFEVNDSFNDERFSDNPLVTGEPHVRFYAGMPIADAGGNALGTLCVIDNEPKELNKHQKAALRFLASQVALLLKLRSANSRLLESEKIYTNLIDGIDDVIFELHRDFTFKFVNKKFVDLSGYTEQELSSTYFWDLVKKGYRKEVISYYEDQIRQQKTKSYYELPVLTKNQKEVWVGQRVVFDYDGSGEITRILAVCRDITERRNQDQIFQLLSDNSKDLICLHEPNGEYRYVSKSVKELLGYEQFELIGKDPYDYMHPDDVNRLRNDPHAKTLKGQEVKGVEYRLKNKNGKYLWFESYTKPILDASNIVEAFQTSSREITARKSVEQQAEKSNNNIKAIIENTDAAIWSIDLSFRFNIINQVFVDLVESVTNEKPRIGDSAIELNNESFQQLKPCYERALKGEKFDMVFSLSIEEEKRYLKEYFNPITSEGKIIGVSVYARDVTDEKLNKDRADRYRDGLKLLNNLASNNYLSTSSRLKKSIELACYFFGVKSGALSRVDDQMIIVEASHNESKIDIKPGTIVPLTGSFTEVLIDRKEPVIIDSVSKLDFNQSKDLAKFGLKSFIGVPVFVHGELYGSLSFGSEETKPAGFDSNDLDFLNLMASWVSSVLERDQYERQLVAEKETLRAFVSAAPAAIAMFNTDIEYIASSSKWNEDYELEKKEIIGKSHYEIFPEIGEEWMEIHQRGVNGEVISRERDLVVGSNGESRWIRWEVRPWYLGADNIGGIIMFTEEITHTVQQEEELVRAKEEAEHAAQAKETFLSTMSHEIRTPMNAIIGISNLLISDNPRPDQVDNLSLLKFSSTNLLTLINDILDFNKIEAGKMELENIDFNLKEVAKNVIETLRIRAVEKNLAVIFDYQSGIPEHFIGDPVRITQVLTNLISNAIKFTAKGYVGLEISGTKSGTGYDLIIQVTDTGIGIPEEKQQSIFDNFTQASSSVTREYGGTGLGLSICKKLLTLMNSEIQLSSALNEGSTFSFTLRLPVGKVKTLQKSFRLKTNVNQIGENSNIHLLIAEDNLANQKVLARFLDRWSFNYEFANNGAEAVDMISDKSYSMVLMDIQMPVMDGFESVRRIRALNTPFHQSVPIFALTASVLLGVQEQVMAAGMNGYLGKPFDPDELYEKILEFAVPLTGDNKGEMPLKISKSVSMGDQEFEKQLEESFKTDLLPKLRELLEVMEKNKTVSKTQYCELSESALLNTFEPLSSLFSVDYEHLDQDLFYAQLKIIVDYFH